VNTQIKLHKILRCKVSEWQGSLIDGCVLTYHFNNPSEPDSFYVCLNILSMNPPARRTIDLSEAQKAQLPKDIRETMAELSSKYLVNPESDMQVRDYEFDLHNPETLSAYKASVEEIRNFSSKGTGIALELLDDDRTKRQIWRNDRELATVINRLVHERLTTENERFWGFHFASNSMFLALCVENYLRGILNLTLDGEGHKVLGYLYEIEKSGDIGEASKRFTSV